MDDFIQEENPNINLTKFGVADKKTKINWTCHICGYKWSSTIYSRTRGHNNENKINMCPVCGKAKRNVSFDEQYPDLKNKWNYELNDIELSELNGTDYHKEFWWNCKIHGPYKQKLSSAIRSLSSKYNGCIKCANKAVDESESLKALYHDVYEEYAIENCVFEDKLLSPYSKERRLWRCKDCGKLYPMIVNDRVDFYKRNKIACPHCKGYKKVTGTYYG